MIELYTIGFTNKTARRFFELLEGSAVKQIIDTRINNTSQLAGFAKGADLAFFAGRVGGIGYQHEVDLAPTKELLERYRSKQLAWPEYELAYLNLLDMRNIRARFQPERFHQSCLLCSEHSPEQCHRRLLAEYLQQTNPAIRITHLM